MKWISVKDHLPDECCLVLVYDKRLKEHRIDYLIIYEKHYPDFPLPYIWAHQLVTDFENVDYWMPLPEPPKDLSF